MQKFSHRFLYLPIFFSGAFAIVYQTIWFRQLSLTLGSTSFALTIILTTFMAGLGIGSLLFGKIADKFEPRTCYQILEFGIGSFALLSLFLISPVNIIYKSISNTFIENHTLLTIFSFFVSFLFIIIPTIFMGGTMPVAVKYLSLNQNVKGKEISFFYWINTLGSAFSAILMPLFLMPKFSLFFLLKISAIGNFLICSFVFLLPTYKKIKKSLEEKETSSVPIPPLIAFFLSGTASLAIETLWNRHLIIVFGGSIYTFGFILGVYLIGIVFGSFIFSFLKKRYKPLSLYFWSLFFSSLFILISQFFLPKISFLQLYLFSLFGSSFFSYHFSNIIILFIFVFPVTLSFGIAFPSAIDGLTDKIKDLGEKIGLLYFINSIGTAFGPIFLTFFILPKFDFRGSYYLIIFLIIFSLFFMFKYIQKRLIIILFPFLFIALLVSLLFPKFNHNDFLSETAKNPKFVLENFIKSNKMLNLNLIKLLYSRNDTEANVVVAESPDNTKTLIINGKSDASDGIDMYTQSLSGHIPFMTGRYLKNVLLIGLGSGVTTHCVLTHNIEKIKSIEISPAVIEGAKKHFSSVNFLCFNDPRSEIIAADGRNYLAQRDEIYNLIISEPSNPWLSGVSSLFTKEFFKLVSEHLSPDGIFCQWTNLYNLSTENVFNIFKTLELYFPYISTFFIPESTDFLLIASKEKIYFDPEGLEKFPEAAKQQLLSLRINKSEDIYKRLMWSSINLKEAKNNLPPNSDSYPWLELLAPKDQFFVEIKENVLKMLKFNKESYFPLSNKEELIKNLELNMDKNSTKAEIISKTFEPSGEKEIFYRFVGYHFYNMEEDLYIEFAKKMGSYSELKWYANQFSVDPFSKEISLNYELQSYCLTSEANKEILCSFFCPSRENIIVYKKKVKDKGEMSNVPIKCF